MLDCRGECMVRNLIVQGESNRFIYLAEDHVPIIDQDTVHVYRSPG